MTVWRLISTKSKVSKPCEITLILATSIPSSFELLIFPVEMSSSLYG
jgi:hypothetical protein